MEHYRVYLRGELAKLGQPGDAAAFLASGGCDVQVVAARISVERVTEAFGSQDKVDQYISRLSDHDLIDLTSCCDRWRGNHIASDLSPNQHVEIIEVPVARITLRQAEPRLGPIFELHGRRLAGIAQDPAILGDPEYRRHLPGDPVAVPIFLAKPEPNAPGTYRVIDGIHRAIQLFRNGEKTIRLCVIRNQ